jgi:hypothetical protein
MRTATCACEQRYFKYHNTARKSWSKLKVKREELKETFEMYDIDGSGSIDVSELRLMVNELCIPMDDSELNEVCTLHKLVCSLLVHPR